MPDPRWGEARVRTDREKCQCLSKREVVQGVWLTMGLQGGRVGAGRGQWMVTLMHLAVTWGT